MPWTQSEAFLFYKLTITAYEASAALTTPCLRNRFNLTYDLQHNGGFMKARHSKEDWKQLILLAANWSNPRMQNIVDIEQENFYRVK